MTKRDRPGQNKTGRRLSRAFKSRHVVADLLWGRDFSVLILERLWRFPAEVAVKDCVRPIAPIDARPAGPDDVERRVVGCLRLAAQFGGVGIEVDVDPR